MAARDSMGQLWGWEGYEVENCWQEYRGAQRWQVIRLKLDGRRLRRCSGCGRSCTQVHDVSERRVRDLPVFEARVELLVPRVRLQCEGCGAKLESLAWLEPHTRVTSRMAESVSRLCAVMSVRHVAQFYGLSWSTVKRIDKTALSRRLGEPDLRGLKVIAMDEFAIQKGHRYATVVVEPVSKRVLWVGRGRSREDVAEFFKALGPTGCGKLEAVAMDMSAAYAQEVRKHCPQAAIVYDLFHVLAKYGREVIDRVRVDEANRLRSDRKARQLIKGSKWLLLRNAQSLEKDADRVRLRELLAANRRLFTAYVLKDDLKSLWRHSDPALAQAAWKQWHRRAMSSRIDALKRFARNLKSYLPGIVSHCRWPLGTNLVEGINHKIKLIKRMAFGFRDDEYFFLKIRAAFPGN